MSSGDDCHPRLCIIRKWADFAGYGFNLHAERGRAGQYIGKVDDDSPAQAAGMKEGDRIVEVNDVNIGNENHSQVVNRIKAAGDHVSMLLVDSETDRYFKEQKIVITSDLPEVHKFETPPRPGDEEPPAEPPSYNEVQQDDELAERLPTPEPEAEPEDEQPPSPEPEVESEPEPEPVIVSSVTAHHDHHPRLCLIRKWPDFQGYGFNLHSEKDKPGQLIGLVDADSPAEDADLRKGDRIIEINGDNIENSSHQEVIMKIKAGGEQTQMLVVDSEADEYYKNNGITVTEDMPEVVRNETTPRAEPAVSAMSYTPRLCHIVKWHDFNGYGFNLHAEKERGAQYIGKIDENSPAQEGGLKENDRIIEVNGTNIEDETHSQVITRIKAGGDETRMLVVDKEADTYYKSKGITVTSSMPEVKRMQTTRREAHAVSAPVSAPAVTNGNTVQPAPTRVEAAPAASQQPPAAQANGGDVMAMKMSAAEMRAMLASKKKKDPKQKSNMDFRSKYEIFQQM